jgi:hypothetical protein
MFVDKKTMIGLVVLGAILLGGQIWTLVALHDASNAARNAETMAGNAGTRCGPCGSILTRNDLDQSLLQLRSDAANAAREVRLVSDQVVGIRGALPDLDPLVRFLRFSSAYAELLLEHVARAERVDVDAVRRAVVRMFEGRGGRPENWVWGANVPAAPPR